jgi:hypothetical protein
MSNPDELDRELREYLQKEPNLNRGDRIAYLRTIFNKHLEFNKLEHSINYRDMGDIIAYAKSTFTQFKMPLNISGRVVDTSESPQVAVIESTISYLNKMNLLKKLVKFDYRG